MANDLKEFFLGSARYMRVVIRRLVKGVLLATWIYFLGFFALISASNSASDFFSTQYFGGLPISFRQIYPYDDEGGLTPRQHLARYLRYEDHPAPIDAVLDVLISDPKWSDRSLTVQDDLIGTPGWYAEQYTDLFGKIEKNLGAIVGDRSLDPKAASITLNVPIAFRKIDEDAAITGPLPQEAITWVAEERALINAEKVRRELFDTFMLLIVLGAFGSLIFLTRDYIAKEVETSIAAYFFRPILGIFLAIAMFVLDILAHSIISTADMLEIRPEPLYLLALASGLLSEQAYEVVLLRSKAALERFKKKVSEEAD